LFAVRMLMKKFWSAYITWQWKVFLIHDSIIVFFYRQSTHTYEHHHRLPDGDAHPVGGHVVIPLPLCGSNGVIHNMSFTGKARVRVQRSICILDKREIARIRLQ
jgi:hypothetical protein